ncbi:DUF6928 family protein [Lentzea cavernae]|uniref:Uncharacterized protein n=1 Tax=Lentzea cavernae TaxID=2020703 RepID=A0ABQ3M709_9PSEU|nr:hypothetical protein [Lentzea cavernae]GHH34323.1 hypothetical protein GCM10017774_18150 [Lentzea cavernae]
MGAGAALVVFGDVRAAVRAGGVPDRSAAEAVIRALRPGCAIEPVADGSLADDILPGEGFAYVAVLPEATIVCDRELATVPVAEQVLEHAGDRPLAVFAQHPVAGGLAFAQWAADGALLRSHHAESPEQHELADAVAVEMFGFTAQSPPGLVVHGFRWRRSEQPRLRATTASAERSLIPQPD